MKRIINYFMLFVVVLGACECLGQTADESEIGLEVEQLEVEHWMQELHFNLVSKEVLKYISSMQSREIRIFLELARKFVEDPALYKDKIQNIKNAVARLTAFSYLVGDCFVEQFRIHAKEGLYLHKLFVFYDNGNVWEETGFSIRETSDASSKNADSQTAENEKAIHFVDITTIDDFHIDTPDKLSTRAVVSREESYHFIPWEYMEIADAAYCAKRDEILKQVLELMQQNQTEELKSLLERCHLTNDEYYWGFSEQDSAQIAKASGKVVGIGIQDGALCLITSLAEE
ncbi:MAG: hypothetical protein J5654_00585 [Victivallales bacterium]|nr:hypothetical protein [Victivallales bacterium]